jgi:hypothetical protein
VRQGQAELLAELAEPGLVQGSQCVRLQTDAARGAADELDDALAGQGLQMLFGCIGRLEAQLGGDLGPRGGDPVRSMALCTRSSTCC